MISVKSPVHRVLQPPGAFKSQKNNSCTPCVPMFGKVVLLRSVRGKLMTRIK